MAARWTWKSSERPTGRSDRTEERTYVGEWRCWQVSCFFGQGAAQPVAAASRATEGTNVQSQSERSPRVPGGPNSADAFSAAPMPDIQIELVHGWWQGNERHSQFKFSNVENANASLVHVWCQPISQNEPKEKTGDAAHKFDVNNMAPKTSQEFTVVCKPRPGFVCDKNCFWAGAHDPELRETNNHAKDDV